MSPVSSRTLPHDRAMLFALRAVLSTAILGPPLAWLTTRPIFSWEIGRLSIFFGTSAVISTLVLGPRNARWLYRFHLSNSYGLLFVLLLSILMWVSLASFAAAWDTGERLLWLICGGGLAAIAVCTSGVIWWAERRGV